MTVYKKIRIIPVIIGLTGLIAAAWLFLNVADLTQVDRPREIDISAVPDVFLTDIRQTTYENGVQQWTLAAASARLLRKEQSTIIKDLLMTVYAADGNTSRITAGEGTFSMDTGDAEIFGNVIIDNGTYRIHTRSLQYRQEPQILSTDQPVMIKSDALSLTGDGLTYDLRRMKTVIEGNVEGNF